MTVLKFAQMASRAIKTLNLHRSFQILSLLQTLGSILASQLYCQPLASFTVTTVFFISWVEGCYFCQRTLGPFNDKGAVTVQDTEWTLFFMQTFTK